MVICLERGADLHTAQLMPLPLTVSCFSKIQIGFTFLVLAYLGSPGQGPLNGKRYVCCDVDRCQLLILPVWQCLWGDACAFLWLSSSCADVAAFRTCTMQSRHRLTSVPAISSSYLRISSCMMSFVKVVCCRARLQQTRCISSVSLMVLTLLLCHLLSPVFQQQSVSHVTYVCQSPPLAFFISAFFHVSLS